MCYGPNQQPRTGNLFLFSEYWARCSASTIISMMIWSNKTRSRWWLRKWSLMSIRRNWMRRSRRLFGRRRVRGILLMNMGDNRVTCRGQMQSITRWLGRLILTILIWNEMRVLYSCRLLNQIDIWISLIAFEICMSWLVAVLSESGEKRDIFEIQFLIWACMSKMFWFLAI